MPEQMTTQVTATEVARPASAAGPVPTLQAITVAPSSPQVMPVILEIGGVASAIAAIIGAIALVVRLITRDVTRDVIDLKHKLGNQVNRIDALDHARTADVERIVRVEASLQNVEKVLERVERTVSDRLEEIITSIREMRNVTLRGG